MVEETIFTKIINKKISSDIVYQDSIITAFRDILPQAPIHIIIVPNEVIETINDVLPKHKNMLGHMILTAAKIAKNENIADNGYRLIINCNNDGGQEIHHVHMHLLGGCPLGPILSFKKNNKL